MSDPVPLAREVLDMNDARDYLATADPLAVYSVGGERYAGIHVSEKIERRLLEASPALARAVIELTAERDAYREQEARVKALADRLDVIANELDADGEDGYADAARTDAHSIRAALKGAAA